ncbi:hypothetical protein VOLCADRAFT_86237 [Volvox carteri f. nagariensis]|uniref:Protein kinase domain-containing protein n=1 Tax=Volvox carteri f. nagariensis TaxID=3068 RepID=D8TI92_VOLCA|nr:uncharacterized protein VOLCADRAFT_86237 [Volvox carteri f. nagariensis]EFJ53200.1 hypothetical protein VOLCADRAFT_86237 [Volvox carteri f. nagariensis]|eukprot:XP_002946205.1 hypothetical protein VOLCADRAFT_86237 [Volvox carteri f. nagariensis]
MGCANSVARGDEEASTAFKKQEPSTSKDQVEVKSVGPGLQETVFASELTKLVTEATSGAKAKDSWVILYKCAELICSAFGIKTCSIIIYTSSGLSCKLACNSGSVLKDLAQQHPDLLPAETLGFVTSTLASQKPVCVQSGDELWNVLSREAHVDFQLLTGTRGSCTALAVLPLCCGGPRCPGAVLLGHTAQLTGVLQQSWLTTLVPLLSLYVVDSYLVRNLAIIEKLLEAGSLSSLAYAVTSELGELFDWCYREDVEARLVVLGQDGDTATVYFKAPHGSTAVLTNEERTSMRSGVSSSALRSCPNALLLEDGLVGVHMLLENTLTKRCLSGRQRLLFVADVMQALKLYGEPWKDIFFDNAVVMTPCWVLAAPLMQEGKKLGAVLWLSSCRVNSEVLMRTASTRASPIIHAVSRATAVHQLLAAAAGAGGSGAPVVIVGSNGGGGGGGDSLYSNKDTAATTAPPPPGGCGGGGGGGNSQYGHSSFTHLSSSRQSSTMSRGRAFRPGTGPGHGEDMLPGGGSTDHEGVVVDLDGKGGGPAAANAGEVPVRYVLRHSPSTSALMRLYKSTIAQRAPAADEDRVAGSIHEIRILSKAGEGAFGSVYVGRWRNIVVAVKIIKDTSGTRSLKTAWELAVNKSLSHPSIVTEVMEEVKEVEEEEASGPAAVLGLGQGLGLGGSQSGAVPPPPPPPLPPPSFGRISAGSNTATASVALGPLSAALLKPSKPLAPKVHTGVDAAGGTSPLPPDLLHMDFIVATLSEVAAALQYMHAQGFVHCDLKPENVLLKEANNRRGFTAKLADFGLSELRSADGLVVGDLGGTVTHVAPESVMYRQVSAASDMYAFGILMWELYTGQQPYRTLLSHISKREDRHRALLARVDYWALAVQCWSPEPTSRPTTGEVLAALEVMYGKYVSGAAAAAPGSGGGGGREDG